jgi:hypothetical protein
MSPDYPNVARLQLERLQDGLTPSGGVNFGALDVWGAEDFFLNRCALTRPFPSRHPARSVHGNWSKNTAEDLSRSGTVAINSLGLESHALVPIFEHLWPSFLLIKSCGNLKVTVTVGKSFAQGSFRVTSPKPESRHEPRSSFPSEST